VLVAEELAEPVAADLAELLPRLAERGFHPSHWEYTPEAFGNYLIDFKAPTRSFRVIRDRSQYILGGDQEELAAAGLWRAFDDKAEFANALLSWLGRA
jgi:hypothetical protein